MLRYIGNIIGRPVTLFVALLVLWLALSGQEHWGNPVLWCFGLASISLCVWFADRAGMMDREGVPTSLFPGLLSYLFWLTFEIGKANVAVVRHALSHDMKLSPKMVEVPADQKTDLGMTLFANSITLTPGTVSVDVHEGGILVHGLTEELADIEGMADMGRRVNKLDKSLQGSDAEGGQS